MSQVASLGGTLVSKTELGRRLLNIRRERRLKQREVAAATGVEKSVLSRWERGGGVEYPDLMKLDRVAAYYGVRTSDLLDSDFDTRVWGKRPIAA